MDWTMKKGSEDRSLARDSMITRQVQKQSKEGAVAKPSAQQPAKGEGLRVEGGVFMYEGSIQGKVGKFTRKRPQAGARPTTVLPGSTIPLYRVASWQSPLGRLRKALTDIESALETVKAAEDPVAVLRALDEIEKAVMRSRAALHGATQEGKKTKRR